MKAKRKHTINASLSRAELLLSLYKRAIVIIIPTILVYFFCGWLDLFKLDKYQLTQGILTIVIGAFVLSITTNKTLAEKIIFPLHWAMIIALTGINLWWVFDVGSTESVMSFLLMSFICGMIILNSLATAVYFLVLTSFVAIISLTDATNAFSLKLAFYIFFFGTMIFVFARWREELANKNKLASDSYQNLFNDLAEQIYILDLDYKVIDINNTALEFLKKAQFENWKGQVFNELFCSDDPIDLKKFEDALSIASNGQKAKFEAKCRLKNSVTQIEKEFSVRKSVFYDQEVFIVSVRSLQNQREFEQRLIESRENIARVLENINSFVFNITYRKSGEHQVNYVSSRVRDVFGIQEDEYITLVKSGRLSEIFYHEDREETIQLFNSVIETVQEHRIRVRIVRDGQKRWIEEKIFPKKSESGDAIQLFGIVTDITEQVEANEQLKNSELRYRQIFERNLAGVYKTHVDGSIIDANPAFAKILGYESVEELKKLNIKDLYYQNTDRKDYLDRLRTEGFLNNYISVLRRKDGKKLILNNNVTIQPDEDGILNIIEGTLVDITEIEETAQALRLSEEKYRLLFEESKEGILLLSVKEDGFYVDSVNAGAANIFNLEKEKMTGLKVVDLTNEAENLKAYFRLKPEHIEAEKEWVFKRGTGEEFFAEISFVFIKPSPDEGIIQLVVKDISERKKNQQALIESQQSFKNIVDNSPAAILIFAENELVYMNPEGEKLYYESLNTKSKNLDEVFPEKQRYLIEDILAENNQQNNFTELQLGNGSDQKQYSISAVKTIYNSKKASLFLLHDITLQSEYNRQIVRAELAEETNKKLQDEIERHKKTQAELLEKTFWLNALFESSYNLFIISLDRDFRISSFNENFRRMIKNTLNIEPKIGDNFLDIFNTQGEARKKIEKRFEEVLNGKTLEFISHYTGVKGEIWVESFLNPVKIGDREVSEISFISHEITDKIVSQQKIKESEENNRAILRALPDILTKVNKDGYFVEFRMSQSNSLDPVLAHLKTENFAGNRVEDVLKDKNIVSKFLEMVNEVLKTGEVLSHTFELKDPDSGRAVYYENRFSKMNENEVIVLARNVTESMEYETMLVETVKEKEVLLKEVHHRVKNNLQVINSILNLQSSYVEDQKTLEIINESQNRIRSMSYIHESLYQTKDFSSINFAEYITNLVQNLVHSYEIYEGKIDLKMDVMPVKLALDQAIPCGLILNELVSNALKYAYPGDQKGQIVIEVSEENNRLKLGVADFGVGLPKDFKIENTESLGLSLVHTLVDQLDGELILKTLGGTKFLITFEKQEV